MLRGQISLDIGTAKSASVIKLDTVKIGFPIICLSVPEKVPYLISLFDFVDRVTVITSAYGDVSAVSRMEAPVLADCIDISRQFIDPELNILFPEIFISVVLAVFVLGKPVYSGVLIHCQRLSVGHVPGDAAGEHLVVFIALLDDRRILRAN